MDISDYLFCGLLILKLLKPQSQKERAQWEVGVGHAEAALQMTREERNENYTFIYIDKEPSAPAPAPAPAPASDTVTSPRATSKNRPERKQRRSKGSAGAKEEHIPRRQQPRRQCSINSSGETSSPNQGEDDMDQEQSHSPEKPDPHPKEPSPPPVRTPWKTAAARKLLPLSITMKKLNVEIIKCDWQLPKQKLDLPKKTESEERPSDQVQSPEVEIKKC